jgi:hypothetical protein
MPDPYKIIARSDLNVDVELLISEANRTIGLAVAGNLTAKEGATEQAVYSKLVDLWATSAYQDSPFPMNAIDALSGQYQIGIDAGGNANGWTWLNDATRSYLRDGGCEEYNSSGVLISVYASMTGLGAVSTGSQLYYQRTTGESPIDFTYEDQANEMVQVYSDANGDGTPDYDYRTFFKGFVREQGKKYSDSVLADTGKTATGAFIVNLLLSNEDDLKITASDATIVADTPYTGMSITYFGSNQSKSVGGVNYPYTKVINGNNGTLEQIYEKVQHSLRQDADIDAGAGTVNGKTADALLNFVGDTLVTTAGVFIENIQAADSNRIDFTDENGVVRRNLFTSAGALGFNSIMVGSGSSYRLIFSTGPGTDDDYGEDDPVTVQDASGNDIEGVISAASIDFDFDYDGDTRGGNAEDDKPVTLVGVRPNFSKFAVATGTLTRSKTIVLSLVAETDRAYL